MGRVRVAASAQTGSGVAAGEATGEIETQVSLFLKILCLIFLLSLPRQRQTFEQ
jgi:hypothetical protein